MGGDCERIIDSCFKFDTVQEIIDALAVESKTSDWAKKQLEILKSVSPTSLKVTLAHVRKGSKMGIADCFKMEYRMVAQFLVTPF